MRIKTESDSAAPFTFDEEKYIKNGHITGAPGSPIKEFFSNLRAKS
jgi:hypothetical protein